MSEIEKIVPGQPISDAQRDALRKENAEASTNAHMMAADQRARDEREAPLMTVLSDSIKDKLKQLPPAEPEEVAPPA